METRAFFFNAAESDTICYISLRYSNAIENFAGIVFVYQDVVQNQVRDDVTGTMQSIENCFIFPLTDPQSFV